jgi:phosphatidylglycerol---prolipoprotein diacylglyceryl transferase
VYPSVEVGGVRIYTYGLMLAMGLGVGIGLLCYELRRKRLDPAHGLWIALITIPAGVLGSRLLFLIEEWGRVPDPARATFSSGGLSFYGGLALAVLGIYPYVKWKGIRFLVLGDAAAPGALLGRGIGRIGCHLSGDGDYGLPTTLPWGADYSSGVYPPSRAIARLPELAQQFPGGVAPDHLRMHPTGVYEFLISAMLFVVLWRFRSRLGPDGRVLMVYLVLTGVVRLGLEFLALAPVVALGLTKAQLFSLALITIGGVGFWYLRGRARSLRPVTGTR